MSVSSSVSSATSAPERLDFRTELKQLLDLIIHSLYTKKEIFLRELVSNAADAIDKLRFTALTRPELLRDGAADFRVRLVPDEKAGTLTVSDNGIGMSREAIVENLGTIARSGTRAFLENLKKADVKDRPELIGQFGVGFYSAFMVADRITVLSRPAEGGPGDGVKWESDGQGQFTVESVEKPTPGTDVVLHLREDAKEFLQEWRLRSVVKQYSDFIEHPIVLETQKEGKTAEDTLNSRKAIWLRSKSEIKEEEYHAFYKQVSRDSDDPLKTIHVAAEGTLEFKAILFIPKHRPMDFLWRQPKAALELYVRRVQIMHECEELLPSWLRFVKGVVDSSDLPLNVSRETLQHNAVLAKIRSNLVNRVLKTLEEMKEQEHEKYLEFYREFGEVLKEGITQDWTHRERIADLLLFESTKTEAGKYTTLAKYVEAMPAEQEAVYFLTGETRGLIENSPVLEGYKSRGQEVLLLTDPIDEFVVQSLHEYKGKKLRAVDRADPNTEKSEEQKKAEESFAGLLGTLKEKLPEVKEVRLSTRLKESAACLVASDNGVGAHFERLMERMGRKDDLPAQQRILELNPDHPAVQALRTIHEKDAKDPRVELYARVLHDQAVIAEGSKVKDPAAFAKRIAELMVGAVGHS